MTTSQSSRWRAFTRAQLAETQQFDLTPPAADLAETIDATPAAGPLADIAPAAPSRPAAAAQPWPIFRADYFPPLAPWLLSLPSDLRYVAGRVADLARGPLAGLPARLFGQLELIDHYEKDGSHIVALAWRHPLAAVEVAARRLPDRRAGWQVEWSIDW